MCNFKKFLIISLCLLCWHCSCDNRVKDGEIPKQPSDHIADVLQGKLHVVTVDSQHIDLSLENVITKSEEVSPKVQSGDAKEILDTLEEKKVLNQPDVKVSKFSEQLRKMRRKDPPVDSLNSKKKSKSPDINDETTEDTNFETEENASLNIETVISTDTFDEKMLNVELESSQFKSDDEKRPTVLPSVTDDVIGSHSSSPDFEPADEAAAAETHARETIPHGQEIPDSEQHAHSEAMPSFDEWKKMMLAEQEKGGHKVLTPSQPGKKLASQKRRRNYASYECGAKIVASNAEGEGTSRILNERVDEYMLNPCKTKIWFVIELCETVQASQIELANFELFSSCPRDFAVSSSDNFPTRDWVTEGMFMAAEQRVLQSFQLKSEGFSKFIKVEFLSHYGKEHYCPLNVVRIFGTSMVDEYEELEKMSDHTAVLDDELDRLDIPVEDKASSNLFGSATDAVYNIVKKAAQVLGQHQPIDENANKGIEQNMSAEHCKLVDDSCTEHNKNITETNISDSIVSSDSLHLSLYHHLRHCDQCVTTSRPSYYSVALPQCRFFQAAFGPVTYKSICDWFKDHLLVTLQKETVIDVVRNRSRVSQKPHSPPPTIISVIIEQKPSPQPLPSYADASSTPLMVDSTPVEETSHLPLSPKTVESTITIIDSVVKPVIQPTKTTQSTEDSPRIDLDSTLKTELPLEDNGLSEAPEEPKPDGEKILLPSTGKVPAKANDTVVPTVTIPSPSEAMPVISNVTKRQEGEEKMDLNYEENLALEMETATVDISTVEPGMREFSVDMKMGDVKFDGREAATRLDPVVVGSTTFSASQKESVFVRMNNRIKSLELNMSLSSQYLQELSQRYRRQMEEMQRAFNRTIGTLNDTAKKAAERDLKQQEIIGNLQSELSNLTLAVDQAMERHIFLMITEVIVMVTIMSLCVRRTSSPTSHEPLLVPDTVIRPTRSDMKRRNSTNSSSPPSTKRVKKRSSSDEALLSDELLIVAPSQPIIVEPLPKIKKRHKKKKQMKRSASNPNMSPRKPPAKRPNKGEVTCAAGIIFSSSAENAISDHFCENCDSEKNCPSKRNHSAEKRTNSIPLKNLTNGGAGLEQFSLRPALPEKDKFSFRKFLKFQKRESI